MSLTKLAQAGTFTCNFVIMIAWFFYGQRPDDWFLAWNLILVSLLIFLSLAE